MQPRGFGSATKQAARPDWVSSVNRLVLVAEREEIQQRQCRLWDDHFADLTADPSVTSPAFTWAVIQSALNHVLLRLRFGSATGMVPVMTMTIVAPVAPVSTLADAAPLTVFPAAFLSASFATLVLLEVARIGKPRFFIQRAVWALAAAGASLLALTYIVTPELYAQEFIGISIIPAALAAAIAAATAKNSTVNWGAWALLSLATASVSTIDFVAVAAPGRALGTKALFLLALLNLSLAVSFGRLALERRSQQIADSISVGR